MKYHEFKDYTEETLGFKIKSHSVDRKMCHSIVITLSPEQLQNIEDLEDSLFRCDYQAKMNIVNEYRTPVANIRGICNLGADEPGFGVDEIILEGDLIYMQEFLFLFATKQFEGRFIKIVRNNEILWNWSEKWMIFKKDELEKRIRLVCWERLSGYFPAGLPEELCRRCTNEYENMLDTKCVEEVVAYALLSEKSNREGDCLKVKETAGSSILTWLVADTGVDPNDAYYYCEKCGHYERIHETVYGIDAEDKKCPECHELMRKSGYSLPYNIVWGNNKKSLHYYYDPFIKAEIMEIIKDEDYKTVYDKVKALCKLDCVLRDDQMEVDNETLPVYSRESLYRTLISAGNDEETAYKVMDFVRKGKAADKSEANMLKWDYLLETANISPELKRVCENIKYLGTEAEALYMIKGIQP